MKCDVFLIFVCSSRVPRPRYTGDNYGEAHYTRKVRKYTRHDNFFLLLSHVVRYRLRCCSPPPQEQISRPLSTSLFPVAAVSFSATGLAKFSRTRGRRRPFPRPSLFFLSGLVFGAERAQGKGEERGGGSQGKREGGNQVELKKDFFSFPAPVQL